MRLRLLLLLTAVAAVALVQPLGAIAVTTNVTVSATVAATAKLTLSVLTVTFPDADPDVTPSIPANEGAITVTAKGKTSAGSTISLTLQAADDLRSGTDVILIPNVTWTASGAGYVPGTMSNSTAQTVGSWTNSGNRVGTLSFVMLNSWNYPTGSYSAAATYTLTAP
jgi:hypothetical protein